MFHLQKKPESFMWIQSLFTQPATRYFCYFYNYYLIITTLIKEHALEWGSEVYNNTPFAYIYFSLIYMSTAYNLSQDI